MRLVGGGYLALALWAAARADRWGIGTVAWHLTAAGLALVALMAYAPRLAAGLVAMGAALAPPLALSL